jgi:hypothetical protein
MDFVDWCGVVLKKIVEMSRNDPEAIRLGWLHDGMLSDALFGVGTTGQATFTWTNQRHGMLSALDALAKSGLISKEKTGQMFKIKPSQRGRELAQDMAPLWEHICEIKLDAQQEQVITIINRLSAQEAPSYAWLEEISNEKLLTDWDGEGRMFRLIADSLRDMNFIYLRGYAGQHFVVTAGLAGLIWETRRGFTSEARFIDGLISEWETTSVDFKRELHLDTADQKAEFVKDVLGLTNTQASGKRWMIIGFDDKTHTYYGPPDARITQNRIEQILAQYTVPLVDVRYEIVDYRTGQVGKIEVRRDPKKLPYSVANSIGDRKRITVGQIFVRHGSQTEGPTPAELVAIQEEGDLARAV